MLYYYQLMAIRSKAMKEVCKRLFQELAASEQPTNVVEASAMRRAGWRGFKAFRGGWPDLWMINQDGRLLFVECKSRRMEGLRPEQLALASIFHAAGFEVYRYDPHNHLQKIDVAKATAKCLLRAARRKPKFFTLKSLDERPSETPQRSGKLKSGGKWWEKC